jgi:L-lactate dehydrogenase complex protein LldG
VVVAASVSDRDVILGRIRTALADRPAVVFPDDGAADYRRSCELGGPELTGLFAERCRDYRANVTICDRDAGSIRRATGDAFARHDARTIAVPPGLHPECMHAHVRFLTDVPELPLCDLDRCDGVLTGCELAIAATGTVVLAAGPGQGRRALSLIPDLHVCIVLAQQIVETVPEAMARLAPPIAERQPITFISGPSATSDIELKRIEGVHGPRHLEVIVLSESLDRLLSSDGIRAKPDAA